jgi:dTDP-4-dehydrorhamnose reductase
MPRETRFATRADLDVTDKTMMREAVTGCDVIIHAAAMTDVDACENEPDAAWVVNVEGSANVAACAAAFKCHVVYISTDFVFDGSSIAAYSENDTPSPINHYGRSKLAGEAIMAEVPHCIIRTSWVFGEGPNFVQSILKARASVLNVVDDQWGRPTFAKDLAVAVHQAAERRLTGIFHVSGDGPEVTRAGLAREVLSLHGASKIVNPVTSEDYQRLVGRNLAPRPRRSVFSLDKARSAGLHLRGWPEGLKEYIG